MGIFRLFCGVVSVVLSLGPPRVSWGVEYLRDKGPAPVSVEELSGPLRAAFEPKRPLPPMLPWLKASLKQQQPFVRDSAVLLNLRTYYFNRGLATLGKSEGWAIGASLAYQSGWFRNFLAVGGEVFTAQKLYGPTDRDGTGLLRPGQKGYTVLGRAYGKLRYHSHELTLYRQYYDLPYVNQDDNRLIPNTFEGYSVRGRLPHLEYIVGYISRVKRKDSSTFISMSEAAGAPSNRKRGLLMAGGLYAPSDDFSVGAITYYVPDAFNTVYAEANYTRSLTTEVSLKLSAQFTDQRSVGQALVREGETQVGGSQVALSYKHFVVRTAFSIAGGGRILSRPLGGYPGYLSLMISDFNRSDEKAWLIGLSYDFGRLGVEGLSFYTSYARGHDAQDAPTGGSLPDQEEFDLTVDYRIEQGPMRGVWFRARMGLLDVDGRGGTVDNFRFIINYALPLI